MKWLDTARAYRDQDPAVHSLIEVILLYPGFHALGFYRVAHRLFRVRLYFLARLVSQVGRFFTQVEIHPGAELGRRFVIDHGSGVVIGETARVGDDCLIHHGVTLGSKSRERGQRHPTLLNGVQVGANAQIIGDIVIGNNVVIGAGSVVTKAVPDDDIVAGVPAKSIRR